MIKLDILPYPIYKFQIDASLADRILDHVQTIKYEKNRSNDNNLDVHINYYHEELIKFFENSIKTVKNIYFREHINFPIVDCWANRYGPLEKISNHTHSNSVISGLYYANAEENFGSTVFNILDPWCSGFFVDNTDYNLFRIYKDTYKLHKVKSEVFPEKGCLLLFPSHIYHSVKPNLNKNVPRYTISFNTFPSGVVSMNPTSILEINALSIHQKRNGLQK